MGKMKAIPLGETAIRLFLDLPDRQEKQAGWLIRRLARFAVRGEEPESVPPAYLGSWLAIRGEAQRLVAISRARSEAGSWERGARKDEQTSDKTGTNNRQKATKGNKRQQTATERERERDTLTDGSMVLVKPSAGADARANSGEQDWHEVAYWQGVARESLKQAGSAQSPSTHRTIDPSDHRGKTPEGTIDPSDHRPIGPSGKPKEGKWDGSFDRKRFDEDPYDYLGSIPPNLLPEFAAWICGEGSNDDAKRCYGGFSKQFGEMALRNEIERFIGELKAGENIKRPGAVFQSRIKAIWNE